VRVLTLSLHRLNSTKTFVRVLTLSLHLCFICCFSSWASVRKKFHLFLASFGTFSLPKSHFCSLWWYFWTAGIHVLSAPFQLDTSIMTHNKEHFFPSFNMGSKKLTSTKIFKWQSLSLLFLPAVIASLLIILLLLLLLGTAYVTNTFTCDGTWWRHLHFSLSVFQLICNSKWINPKIIFSNTTAFLPDSIWDWYLHTMLLVFWNKPIPGAPWFVKVAIFKSWHII
jgi:hypothetical protein